MRTTSMTQQSWHFFHDGQGPLASTHPYDLRQALRGRIGGAPLEQMAVAQSRAGCTIIARTPEASEWMQVNMPQVMAAVAAIAQRELAVRPDALSVSFEPTSSRNLFTCSPVVSPSKGPGRTAAPWDLWQRDELAPEQRRQLSALVADGVRRELASWGVSLDAPPSLTLIEAGRPMILAPERGPRGLARLGVRFIATWRLGGRIFVGLQPQQGRGELRLRGTIGPAEKQPAAEEALQ